MYVAPLNVVERELEYYKLAYGKRLEPGITVKSKTKETFGNILGGLNESKTDLIPLDMEIINVEVDETGWVGDVREITYTLRLNTKEREIYKMLVTKGRIDSSYTDEFGLSVFMMTGDEFNVVRDLDYISMYKGDKRDLDALLLKYLKTNKSDNYVERKPIMGKKAEPHFGDIIENL